MLRAPRRSCLCKIREGCPANWEEQKSAGAWGIKKGGERVLLLVEKAAAQNSGCLLLGPSPQREGRKGPVPGFSVPGFPAGGIGIEQDTPLGMC